MIQMRYVTDCVMQALALLVEEKTDLLSRLRMGNERVGQLEEMLRQSNVSHTIMIITEEQ